MPVGDDFTRWHPLQVASVKDRRHLGQLLALASSGPTALRPMAVSALGRFLDEPAAVRALVEALDTASGVVNAMQALTRSLPEDARDAVSARAIAASEAIQVTSSDVVRGREAKVAAMGLCELASRGDVDALARLNELAVSPFHAVAAEVLKRCFAKGIQLMRASLDRALEGPSIDLAGGLILRQDPSSASAVWAVWGRAGISESRIAQISVSLRQECPDLLARILGAELRDDTLIYLMSAGIEIERGRAESVLSRASADQQLLLLRAGCAIGELRTIAALRFGLAHESPVLRLACAQYLPQVDGTLRREIAYEALQDEPDVMIAEYLRSVANR
jgi:hypothetical protein